MDLSMGKGSQFVAETQSPEGAAEWKQKLDAYAAGVSAWVVDAVRASSETAAHGKEIGSATRFLSR